MVYSSILPYLYKVFYMHHHYDAYDLHEEHISNL